MFTAKAENFKQLPRNKKILNTLQPNFFLMANFRLDNKTTILTGGATGIGKAICRKFAANGSKVHILDVSQKASETVAEIVAAGGTAVWHECDITSHEEVRKTIGEILGSGPVDILVNNAGIGFVGNLEATSEQDLDRLYQVNVKGMYNCMHAVIGQMKSRRQGVILNISSIVSKVGIPDRFAYSMTKGAVLTMTLSVALDYIHDGIRCNAIAPARIHTPFVDAYLAKNYPGKEAQMFEQLSKTQPVGRMGTPEEVANLALYLCSEEAAFVTGCEYPIDGGFLNLKP